MILFVADGARWIWNRVGALLRRLGIKPGQVNELVDFYHAVEHLGTIAALQRRWAGVERQHWIVRQRRRLLKGKRDEVQAAIDELCGPRSSKELRRERDYFKRNAGKGRMDYARVAALKLELFQNNLINLYTLCRVAQWLLPKRSPLYNRSIALCPRSWTRGCVVVGRPVKRWPSGGVGSRPWPTPQVFP